jgi:hypothetical protein
MNGYVAPDPLVRGCAQSAQWLGLAEVRLPAFTRVASLRRAEECLRPYTNDVENR